MWRFCTTGLARLPLLAILLALGLAGCAQAPRQIAVDQLAQDQLFPLSSADAATVADEAQHLFDMSESMRLYAERVLRDTGFRRDRRQALIDALYLKDALQLAYDAEATRNAAAAFDSRSGNCLSLVVMTAAFARYLQVPVAFQQVLLDAEYSRSGDLYFASGHVNIRLGRHGVSFPLDESYWLTIDFLPQVDLRGQRVVELQEKTLVAMYLNNRAAETLAAGHVAQAYSWARAATQRDPEFAAAANTLGAIYQRAGFGEPAERAFRYALEREPQSASGWSNLARLLDSQGRIDEARVAHQRLAALETYPPFWFLERGREALLQGDATRARDLLLRELRRQPQQHEVHFWLARAYAALGDASLAARHLGLAADYSPTRQTRALYAGKLERLRATHSQ